MPRRRRVVLARALLLVIGARAFVAQAQGATISLNVANVQLAPATETIAARARSVYTSRMT